MLHVSRPLPARLNKRKTDLDRARVALKYEFNVNLSRPDAVALFPAVAAVHGTAVRIIRLMRSPLSTVLAGIIVPTFP